MNADDIKSAQSFERWLKARPETARQVEAVSLAGRAACRVAPIFALAFPSDRGRNANPSALPALRAILTSLVWVADPTRQVKFAASVAASAEAPARGNAAVAAARAAADAAAAAVATTDVAIGLAAATGYNAATAAFGATGASSSAAYMWDQVRDDARMIEAGASPLSAPLWSAPEPDWFHELSREMRARWRHGNSTHWEFWTRWWDGALSGKQLDWKLQEAVALIPEAVWDAGPAAVAEAIRGIEVDYAVERTPNAEFIELNPATNRFRAVPDTRLPTEHLADVNLKIADAADTFGGLENSDNRYTAARGDLEHLRVRRERDNGNPRALYDLCRNVARRLEVRVRDQSLPSDDPLVEECIQQLNEAALDIVNFDEKTRDVVSRRAAVNLRSLDVRSDPGLTEMARTAALISEGVLVEDIPEDARLILDPHAPDEDRKRALYSEVSRLSRIRAWYNGLDVKGKAAVIFAGAAGLAGGANAIFDFFAKLQAGVQWMMQFF